MGKIGPYPDQPQGGIGIGRILHPAEHGQSHLGDGRMGHFVQQHEQHIAGHEFREPLNIFRRQALHLRIAVAERERGPVDPGLKFSRLLLIRRLGRSRRLGWSG